MDHFVSATISGRQRKARTVERCVREDRPILVDQSDPSVLGDGPVHVARSRLAEGAVIVGEGRENYVAIRIAGNRRIVIAEDRIKIDAILHGAPGLPSEQFGRHRQADGQGEKNSALHGVHPSKAMSRSFDVQLKPRLRRGSLLGRTGASAANAAGWTNLASKFDRLAFCRVTSSIAPSPAAGVNGKRSRPPAFSASTHEAQGRVAPAQT